MTDQIPQFDYVETLWNLRLGVNNYEEHMSYYKRVFDINVPTILLKLAKAQKDTLLHRLIRVECDLGFRAIADNYDLQTLQNYIKFYLDEEFGEQLMNESIVTWYKLYLNSTQPFSFTEDTLLCFYIPITSLINLIFYNLFPDKSFLYRLNTLTSYIGSQLTQNESPEFLVKDGCFRRTNPPKWLKEGIFKRDQGHCIHCEKDLTGLWKLEKYQLDHIIPLAKGGTNDPTNWQLLCRDCNLRKSDNMWTPPKRDLVFWV